MNTLDPKQLTALAAEYRLNNAEFTTDYNKGFVLIYGNEVCGWSLEPSPSSWKPGTIAIDLTGKMKVAVGGNDYDGAQAWGILADTYSVLPACPLDSPTLQANTTTVCCLCGEDYGDLAEECFIANTCPDCLDDASSLEDLLDKALTPSTNPPEQPRPEQPESSNDGQVKALVYLPEFAKHTANHHSEQIDGPVVVMGCDALENLLRLIALEATTGNLHQYSRFLARDLHTQRDRHVLEFRDLL